MDTLNLGLEWFLNPDHLPFLVGQHNGWFADAGIDLGMIEPEEHLDAMEAIEDGDLDVAVTEPLHLVEDVAEGHQAVGLARFLHTNGGVMYDRDGDIERPRDMAGARIQYPGAPGPGGPAIVGTMIEEDGGDYDPDAFEPVNNSFYHTDALIDGKADVATLSFYNFEIVEARHRRLDADFFALKDWGVPDFCQLIFTTSRERLAEKADAFDRFLEVVQRGLDYLHQHPRKARQIYFDWTDEDPDDPMVDHMFQATVPCFTFDFTMSDGYYDELQNWMADHELIAETIDPSNYWTNELVL